MILKGRKKPKELAEIADPWRRAVKERLREVVRQHDNNQRALARKWLGSADASGQISQWCSDTKTILPGTDQLARLRERCGVSLDWLLAQPATKSDGEKDWAEEWTVERRAKLAEEMQDYGGMIVSERVMAKDRKRGYSLSFVRAVLPPWYAVMNELRGDFFAFFENAVAEVTDRRINDAWNAHNYEVAHKCRLHHHDRTIRKMKDDARALAKA